MAREAPASASMAAAEPEHMAGHKASRLPAAAIDGALVLLALVVAAVVTAFPAPVVPPGIELGRAGGREAKLAELSGPGTIVVRIDRDNAFWAGDERIAGAGALGDRLRQLRHADRESVKLLLVVDGEAFHANVARALGAAARAGAETVQLATIED